MLDQWRKGRIRRFHCGHEELLGSSGRYLLCAICALKEIVLGGWRIGPFMTFLQLKEHSNKLSLGRIVCVSI